MARTRKKTWLEDASAWAWAVIPGVVNVTPRFGVSPLDDRLEVRVREERLDDAKRVVERHPRLPIDLLAQA